jgi:4-amino-4-deoxy-L-arabinose transferase-like glycosyltransferase
MFRMFDPANGPQIAWLLPFALIGGVLSLWHWRANHLLRAAAVLWLGWVLLFAGVFSYAQGIYHSYYTSAMAPGIGALVGMGALALIGLVKQNRGWLFAVAGTVGVTITLQLHLAGDFENYLDWAPPLMLVTVAAGGALLAATLWRRLTPAVGLSVVVAGLMLIPTAWSGYEAAHASLNTTLPQAGPRQGAAGRSFGSQAFDSGTTQLATWLLAHNNPDARWDLAATSAQQASSLIAGYDLSVMALGGFLGRDPTITVDEFAALVANGDVRYVLTSAAQGAVTRGQPANQNAARGANTPNGGFGQPNGAGGAPGGFAQPNAAGTTATQAGAGVVVAAAQAACTPVTDPSLPTQYRNALYDCAGKAEALAALS